MEISGFQAVTVFWKAEWRSALVEYGAPSATTCGIQTRLKWCADSWDLQLEVEIATDYTLPLIKYTN